MATSSNSSGRLQKAQQAQTTYQGSAQSGKFQAVKAVSTEKADRERTARIIADGETKARELQRQQNATNLALQGQQTAESGLLKLNNLRESDALKVQQLYDTNTLKQKHTFEENKMALESSQLSLSGQVQNARTQAIKTGVEGILSLTETGLKFAGERAERLEKERLVDSTITNTFNIENGDTAQTDAQAVQVETQIANQGIASEDAVQSIDDPIIQDAVRDPISAQTVAGQVKRSDVFTAASDFGTFFGSWVNDTSVIYTRADGSQFTAATMRDSVDVKQVSQAAKTAFYGAAGVGDMPRAQVASTLVPSVVNTASSWETQTSNTIISKNKAERIKSAQLDIIDSLNSGDSLETVFRNGFNGLFGSGGFVGDKAGATEETLKSMLNWAISNNRPDVIQALKGVHKRVDDNGVGIKGTQLGRQYAGLFEEAENGVIDKQLTDNQRTRNFAQDQVVMTNRALVSGLAATNDPTEERSLILEAARRLDAIGTPEARQRAAELRTEPEYSPFTAADMMEQQAQGVVYTNDEIYTLLENGDIRKSEAEALGWNPNGTTSAGTKRQERLNDFEVETKAQGRAAVIAALGNPTDGGKALTPEEKQFILQGSGVGTINNISDEILTDLNLELQSRPDMSNAEVRQFIKERGAQAIGKVSFSTDGGLSYEFVSEKKVFTISHPNNPERKVLDLRGLTSEQLYYMPTSELDDVAVLNARELAQANLDFGAGVEPQEWLTNKAKAMGTNVETLLRAQNQFNQTPMPAKPQPMQAGTPSRLSQFDTNMKIGGVNLDRVRDSVIQKESANDFSAVNPHSGALGYGQVMPENVKSWTTEALGYPVSQREFLRNPEIQMQVINNRFQKMLEQQAALGYTGDDLIRRTASIWYSGRAGLYNNTAPQSYGAGSYPSISAYTLDVLSRYRAG